MESSEITNIITSVGFPIVMCGAMAYYVKYITDKHRETINTINERHANEMKEVTTAINNNTIALQKLCVQMGEKK